MAKNLAKKVGVIDIDKRILPEKLIEDLERHERIKYERGTPFSRLTRYIYRQIKKYLNQRYHQ